MFFSRNLNPISEYDCPYSGDILYLQVLQKNILHCINLQLSIVIFKKIDYFRHASSYNVHVYQLEFPRITSFGHALPHNRHSG